MCVCVHFEKKTFELIIWLHLKASSSPPAASYPEDDIKKKKTLLLFWSYWILGIGLFKPWQRNSLFLLILCCTLSSSLCILGMFSNEVYGESENDIVEALKVHDANCSYH